MSSHFMSKFQDWLIFLRKNLIRLENYNETIIHGIDLGTVMLIMDLTGILSARIKKKKRLKKVGRTPLQFIKRVCDRSYSVSSSKEKERIPLHP